MKNGTLEHVGSTAKIIEQYIMSGKSQDGEVYAGDIKYEQENPYVKFEVIRTKNQRGVVSNSFAINEEICLEMVYSVLRDGETVNPSIHILDNLGNCILATNNADSANTLKDQLFNVPLNKGVYVTTCTVPALFLNDTSYLISCFLVISFVSEMAIAREVLSFNVSETGEMRQEYTGQWIGLIRPKLAWQTQKSIL